MDEVENIFEFRDKFTIFEIWDTGVGFGVFAAKRDDCLSFTLSVAEAEALCRALQDALGI